MIKQSGYRGTGVRTEATGEPQGHILHPRHLAMLFCTDVEANASAGGIARSCLRMHNCFIVYCNTFIVEERDNIMVFIA